MSEYNVGCDRWRVGDHHRDDTPPWAALSNAPFGSLQKQVSIMSLNLNAKIDEIQCHQHADTSAALLAIRWVRPHRSRAELLPPTPWSSPSHHPSCLVITHHCTIRITIRALAVISKPATGRHYTITFLISR